MATAFEATARVGGVWNEGGTPAYRSLVTNVSRDKTSLSDHPLRSPSHYPARAEILRWLDEYADRHDLRRHIRQQRVGRLERSTDGWRVDGQPFDAVVVATGMYGRPHLPALPGMFTGQVVHSRDYERPEPYRGRDVVVIGSGSSAADIAVELAGVARRVSLAVRSRTAIAPKYVGDRPLDHRLTRALRHLPPLLGVGRLRRSVTAEWRRRGTPPPWPPPFVATPGPGIRNTPSDALVPALLSGRIVLRGAITATAGEEVMFIDGTTERADVLLCATGYDISVPFLAPDLLPLRGDDELDLYRHVFHPDDPTLAFVGFVRVSGPVPPVAEMQARWVARVLAGRTALPAAAEMNDEIRERRERATRTGAEYMRVTYLAALDELGALAGVRARWWPDPVRYWFGVVTASQYR